MKLKILKISLKIFSKTLHLVITSSFEFKMALPAPTNYHPDQILSILRNPTPTPIPIQTPTPNNFRNNTQSI